MALIPSSLEVAPPNRALYPEGQSPWLYAALCCLEVKHCVSRAAWLQCAAKKIISLGALPMDLRRRSALHKTLLMALILALPLFLMIYYNTKNKSLVDLPSYPAPEFYWQTERGEHLSLQHLRQRISLIAWLPEGCQACGTEPSPLAQVADWAHKHLSYEGMEGQAYQLIAIGDLSFSLPPDWQRVSLPAGPQGEAQLAMLRQFMPAKQGLEDDLIFILVDAHAQVQGVFPYQGASWELFTHRWSQLTFNHYLFKYLSKHTFLGPKRTPAS